jgi:hypothetical protein
MSEPMLCQPNWDFEEHSRPQAYSLGATLYGPTLCKHNWEHGGALTCPFDQLPLGAWSLEP